MSNQEMEDIIKIVKSLEESGVLIKIVSETSENKSKEQKDGFTSKLLCKLGAMLLRNLMSGKRV